MSNVLIVAPHPDDEILGCGALINKKSKLGDSVFVLVVTRGTPRLYTTQQVDNVRNEALQAHSYLGVKETIFFDYNAPELDIESQADISVSIKNVINKFNIDTVYLPHRGDIHSDHRVVFNASLVACRPVSGSPVKKIYSYETLSETEWAPPFGDDAFIPTHYVDVTCEFNHKIEAMRFFKSQVKSFPNPRSLEVIKSLAMFRGATVGVERAEAFMTIRTIED